jgi:hypothetical protein
VIWEKALNKPLLPPPQAELEALAGQAPHPLAGASFLLRFGECHDLQRQLLLLLRRLDQIERKLDCMLEELQTPTAIGYSARRGNFPKKD